MLANQSKADLGVFICPGDLDAGLKVKLVFKRRIVNQILTTFLPTVLILAIVYATNFFKPFFFEAVVTVNLTALLVLTTLFVSVSNALPPTAYLKMIDIWLIFSQLIPFFEVLLHTFMDCMRAEGGGREINHHGVKVFVSEDVSSRPTNGDMTQVDEELLVEARKKFYASSMFDSNAAALLHMGEFTGELLLTPLLTRLYSAKKLIPGVILTFTAIFWTYGLINYYG